ncbi:MAG: glycosyltransferase family 2 protein [Deltaproteobacteria bacterium]|nr:glycosyltransferase family 2 protein [Deltaproteobacteria bacterium]MBW2447268.1 glycosyltransferase family 2 protein [Deltaproteobacteria bacterium]
MSTVPRISFGMIVLNGEPFLRYSLRALYPHAHQILIVEGACPGASAVATPDGHSSDGSVATIRRFQAEEDPEDKVVLIQRDGFWPDKDAQSQAYCERATGDWLWQIDSDEFYLEEDLRRMAALLAAEPERSGASFHQIAFWGSPDYVVDGYFLRRGADVFHRLFRWGPGYRYTTHRPPTVCDERGRDLRTSNWLAADRQDRAGVKLYHYSLLFPRQVREKCHYYVNTVEPAQLPMAGRWFEECWQRLGRPFRVHNVYAHPSWLERFDGARPEAIGQMIADLDSGRIDEPRRPVDDIERLLSSRRYRMGRWVLKRLQPVDAALYRLAPVLRRIPFFPRSWRAYRPGRSA